MSYAEMRKALEATKSFLDYIVVVDTLSERKHNLSEQIDSALKSEPTAHKAKDGKYVIWLTPDEAGKLCQKYELEDYYFGIDDKNRKTTTAELVSELRKRDGVDAYDVSVDSDSRIILYGKGTEFVDTGTEKGAATILRITEEME